MSVNISLWTKVAVAVQSALAAADTITAITKANPGVVTSTAHGLNNGDYVSLDIDGMFQLDARVVRVANQTANTFELEGVDTTLYDTFVSGTAQAITFGTTMATVKALSASGGEFRFEDTTVIHDDRDTQIPGNSTPAVYNLTNLWDVSDAALVALQVASDTKTRRAFRFTFANAQKFCFSGYVAATLLPTGQAPGVVTTPVQLTIHGRPTYYAT